MAFKTLEPRPGICDKLERVPVASGNPGRYQCCDRFGTQVFHEKAYSLARSLDQNHRGVQQDGQCEEAPHWHRSQELDLQPAPRLKNFKLQFRTTGVLFLIFCRPLIWLPWCHWVFARPSSLCNLFTATMTAIAMSNQAMLFFKQHQILNPLNSEGGHTSQ